MAPEQQAQQINSIEQKEQELSIKDLKTSIDNNLILLSKIDPENKNLIELRKTIDYYKNNEKAQGIIYDGLKQIKSEVDDINQKGENDKYLFEKKILADLENFEKEKDLANIEKNINNIA